MTNSPGTEETVLIPEAAQSPEQERLAADVTREFEKRRDALRRNLGLPDDQVL